MKNFILKSITVLLSSLMILSIYCKNPSETSDSDNSVPILIVPFINDNDITYIQPFGIPLDFGEGDIRPHAAVDFGCGDGVEFIASASGTLGDIWLNYPHSYQFNIVINDKYTIHYCIEPINISSLSDKDKLNAIYFEPDDHIEKGEKICIMAGGGGHLDWGFMIDGERVCPACHLSDEEYNRANELYKSFPGTFEGYVNLCPDNEYHTNPRL